MEDVRRTSQTSGAPPVGAADLPAGFLVTVRTTTTSTVVAVFGELDMATCHDLWDALEPVLVSGARVMLDCHGLTFTDARGLHVLMSAHQQATSVGAEFVIVNVGRQPRRVIGLAGLRDVLPVRWSSRVAAAAS